MAPPKAPKTMIGSTYARVFRTPTARRTRYRSVDWNNVILPPTFPAGIRENRSMPVDWSWLLTSVATDDRSICTAPLLVAETPAVSFPVSTFSSCASRDSIRFDPEPLELVGADDPQRRFAHEAAQCVREWPGEDLRPIGQRVLHVAADVDPSEQFSRDVVRDVRLDRRVRAERLHVLDVAARVPDLAVQEQRQDRHRSEQHSDHEEDRNPEAVRAPAPGRRRVRRCSPGGRERGVLRLELHDPLPGRFELGLQRVHRRAIGGVRGVVGLAHTLHSCAGRPIFKWFSAASIRDSVARLRATSSRLTTTRS